MQIFVCYLGLMALVGLYYLVKLLFKQGKSEETDNLIFKDMGSTNENSNQVEEIVSPQVEIEINP